jgi:NADH:ubiquinone oxidoreductase subunit 6 (subunit J)
MLILYLLLIIFSIIIVISKDTIISLISLIVCFILGGFIFILLNAEYLAFILIIVYGCAISILFLFIIMLLNLRIIIIYDYNVQNVLLLLIFLFIFVFFIIINFFFNINFLYYTTFFYLDSFRYLTIFYKDYNFFYYLYLYTFYGDYFYNIIFSDFIKEFPFILNFNSLNDEYNFLNYLLYYDSLLIYLNFNDYDFLSKDFNLFVDKNFLKYIFFKYINLYSYGGHILNFGIVLYNYYYIFVFLSSLILLIALLGCIFLTYNVPSNKIILLKKSKKRVLKNFHYE